MFLLPTLQYIIWQLQLIVDFSLFWRCRILFCKIKVRPQSYRSYPLWRPCTRFIWGFIVLGIYNFVSVLLFVQISKMSCQFLLPAMVKRQSLSLFQGLNSNLGLTPTHKLLTKALDIHISFPSMVWQTVFQSSK